MQNGQGDGEWREDDADEIEGEENGGERSPSPESDCEAPIAPPHNNMSPLSDDISPQLDSLSPAHVDPTRVKPPGISLGDPEREMGSKNRPPPRNCTEYQEHPRPVKCQRACGNEQPPPPPVWQGGSAVGMVRVPQQASSLLGVLDEDTTHCGSDHPHCDMAGLLADTTVVFSQNGQAFNGHLISDSLTNGLTHQVFGALNGTVNGTVGPLKVPYNPRLHLPNC